MKTTYPLQLDKMVAYVALTGVGQQTADEGNQVIVVGQIALPAEEDCGYLTEELRFREVSINGTLDKLWGKGGDGVRYVTSTFYASTWKEARARAAEWARESIKPLREALAKRAKALEDAGDWE